MTEIALPVDYTYGKIVAKVIDAVGDLTSGGDVNPDGVPVQMTSAITLTPFNALRIVTSTNPATYVRQKPIVCDLNSDGVLSINGQVGVWVYTGQWHVSFATALGISGFDIEVTTSHTDLNPLDLFEVAPYIPPEGTTANTLLVPVSVTVGQILYKASESEIGGIDQSTFGGLVQFWTPPVSSVFQLTRSNNSTRQFGATNGTEYAVGITLPAMTIDQIGLVLGTAYSGGIYIVGLRPLSDTGVIGAPSAQAAVSCTNGDQVVMTTITPVVLAKGRYLLSWCRPASANTATVQTAPFYYNTNLFPLMNGQPAIGHGAVHGILNTGISGSTLPDTVSVGSVGTNQEGGEVPQVLLRRSA